jgi:NAD(P)-dependent dehydrogenase (short-subunit alcohol dehydrogenase family)
MAEPGTREFKGQVVVVAGEASGIGRATARAFVAEGGCVLAADAILFLASRRAGFITGQVLSVSGGLTMAG